MPTNPFGSKPSIPTPHTEVNKPPEIEKKTIELPKPIEKAKEAIKTQLKKHKMMDGKPYNEDFKHEESKSGASKAAILRQYGGNESDIPVNHSYWRMKG